MLATVVRQSVRYPWMVLLGAALLAVFGLMTLRSAAFDVFPEFVPPQANVQTEAPGLVPDQVEALVTRPLEAAINGANGVESVRSESIQGLSVINVAFREGSDPYRARQIVAEALADAAAALPAGVAAPKLTPLTSSTMDLLKIGFVSQRLTPMELRDIVEWKVRPRLLAVRGVARANIFGGDRRRIEVRAKPAELIARGLTLNDLSTAIRSSVGIRGGGFADTPGQRILIEPTQGALDAASIAKAVVSRAAGGAVRIGDVAAVSDAASPKFGDALVMGKPGVLLTLSSQYGANTLDTTGAVESALSELKPALAAQGVTLYPGLHRPADFIETALSGVERDLLLGAVLIGVVLVIFMRDMRVAAIAFVSIPLSLFAAIIVLDRFGLTINTMTLGGLTVALGVVIDDAIVDIENIVRRIRTSDASAARGEIIEAASVEVRGPVVYATFVLALTMLPVLFLSGLQGAFFSPLALAFLLATLASLLVAMTVTPALSALLLASVEPHAEPMFLDRFKEWHRSVLERLCAIPDRIAVATLAVGVVAVLILSTFGHALLPSFRERHYVLGVAGPTGASLDWMRATGSRISRDLLAIPEVASVEQQMGRAEAGEDTWPPNRSEFHVNLKPSVGAAGEDAAQEKIRAVLESYPAIQSETLTFLGDRIGESLSGETAAVSISVFGGDLDTLDRVAAEVAAVLEGVPGSADVQVKAATTTPILRVRFDPERMAVRGVSAEDASDAIELAFQGHLAGQVGQADRTTDVVITLPPEMQRDPEAVGDVLVRSAGSGVRLSDIATLQLEDGRGSIVHEGGQRRQVVTVNPTDRDIAGYVAKARAAIAAKVKLPSGAFLSYGGAAEGVSTAYREIAFNVGMATVATVALLIFAFGLRPALLVLAGAPFALAGGVLAVLFEGGVISLGALVGFVALFGISARNAILLLSHVGHLVEVEGAPWTLNTVLRATRERVTPIMITAFVTALGLAPLAMETGQAGREVQGPMALVVLGGLISSLALSLLFLPALIVRWYRSGRAVA